MSAKFTADLFEKFNQTLNWLSTSIFNFRVSLALALARRSCNQAGLICNMTYKKRAGITVHIRGNLRDDQGSNQSVGEQH